ncbi:hypothetical protein QFZ37_003077 [Chryseobacterium ginsenosidimutans]|uniref:hypothetical protein n=1 Tax=Chryseobacterium ginsenosidimutans TaxID=687846 RepID=UPI00277EEDC6|nr:hypothetical protein [Chryseobacterium ginsenosidimutans]MDQ0594708.1 hypothetical protein [Chryseobacterium ginsenosidimutans]
MKKIAIIIGLFSFTFFFSQNNENYLQIGYHSMCCGTPSADPVMNYVNQFKKKSKVKNFEVYRQSGLGREGEFNLYVGTDGFSKTQKSKFISGLRATVNSQNSKRKTNSDGTVTFDETGMVKKADLSNARNLTLLKNK